MGTQRWQQCYHHHDHCTAFTYPFRKEKNCFVHDAQNCSRKNKCLAETWNIKNDFPLWLRWWHFQIKRTYVRARTLYVQEMKDQREWTPVLDAQVEALELSIVQLPESRPQGKQNKVFMLMSIGYGDGWQLLSTHDVLNFVLACRSSEIHCSPYIHTKLTFKMTQILKARLRFQNINWCSSVTQPDSM